MIRLPLGEAGPKGLKGQIDSKNRYFSAYKFPVPRLPWAFHFACPLARGQVFFVSYGLFKLVCVHPPYILVPHQRHSFPLPAPRFFNTCAHSPSIFAAIRPPPSRQPRDSRSFPIIPDSKVNCPYSFLSTTSWKPHTKRAGCMHNRLFQVR